MVAEFLDQVAPRYRVKCECIHIVVRHQIGAKTRVVCVQQMVGCRGGDIFIPVMSCVEQQGRISTDAGVSDGQKQRARRLTVTFNTKQLA